MLFCLLAAFTINHSNEDHHGLHIGDTAKDFSLKNATDNINGIGQNVGFGDYKEAKGFMIIFTCNHCPYSKAYEDRLIELHNKYAEKGYPMIAINSNDAKSHPSDSYKNMKKRAKDKAFPFAYIYDESQEIAKAYGATHTPHGYVLQKEGEAFKVAYIGAIDDSKKADNVENHYMGDAIDALLEGKEVAVKEAKAFGCTIKWKK